MNRRNLLKAAPAALFAAPAIVSSAQAKQSSELISLIGEYERTLKEATAITEAGELIRQRLNNWLNSLPLKLIEIKPGLALEMPLSEWRILDREKKELLTTAREYLTAYEGLKPVLDQKGFDRAQKAIEAAYTEIEEAPIVQERKRVVKADNAAWEVYGEAFAAVINFPVQTKADYQTKIDWLASQQAEHGTDIHDLFENDWKALFESLAPLAA